MVIESSDESVLLPPDRGLSECTFESIQVKKKPGIATLSIYPKYNPRIKKTFIVRVGDAGSVDIALADVTLSPNSYTLVENPAPGGECLLLWHTSDTGEPITPFPMKITLLPELPWLPFQKRHFQRKYPEKFYDQSASTNTHTHQAVKTPAVAATCTTPDTESSYCSVCGAVIEKPDISACYRVTII